jgi:tetrapyrrole methylase family protein/MazG family protein
MNNSKQRIHDLIEIMAQLRGPNGCPWDRKQNHESLRPYVVEETYELVEAIDGGNSSEICEELGDLLLQIVFHCQIASEENRFAFDDVVKGICEKLVRRHPHVFRDEEALNDEEALQNWERIKDHTEGKRRSRRHNQTPILHRALRLQERAVSFGFDWEETSHLLDKLSEEIGEIRAALDTENHDHVAEEIGDLFFMTVNLARYVDVNPEDALERSLSKFYRRFRAMEHMAERDNRILQEMSLDEMERYWEEAKKEEKGKGKGKTDTDTRGCAD